MRLGKQSERERHDACGCQRRGGGRALGTLRRQSLLQEFELAENLAMHDALEAQAALARVGLELELDQRIDIEPIAALARAEQEIDGVHRIAWAEHAFAGGQRPELEARPAELLERRIGRPAHQGRARDKLGQGFARACGACGACVHCGCGSRAQR